MYLNKTFEIRNSNPNDSLFIQSSSFKNPSEKNLLHFDLSLLADFSCSQISIIENSDANPSLLFLTKLEESLNTTVVELISK